MSAQWARDFVWLRSFSAQLPNFMVRRQFKRVSTMIRLNLTISSLVLKSWDLYSNLERCLGFQKVLKKRRV